MKFSYAALATVIWAGFAPMAPAHEIVAGDLEIIHAHIPVPPMVAKSAAGYMVISNEGNAADRLIGVETPAAEAASVHETEFGSDGVARMRALDGLAIDAGDIVTLEPGGMHVMLMGLTAPLKAGEMVPATLIFEQAGRIEMTFMVDAADEAMDHSTMDHSAPKP